MNAKIRRVCSKNRVFIKGLFYNSRIIKFNDNEKNATAKIAARRRIRIFVEL